MKKKFLFPFALFLLSLALAVAVMPVNAEPSRQAFYQTPTPDADNRIIYVVQAGDSCLRISLLTGVELTQLRQLNNLDEECVLSEGQELVLAVVEAPTAAIEPTATPGPPQPTPTPFNGTGEICVYLFADVNGNALADTDEGPIAGGAISISDKIGKVSLPGVTDNSGDPTCFADVPEGEYNISVAPPEGFNPTTSMNYPLVLKAGESSILDFGAQISSAAIPVPVGEGGKSPLLAILGGVLIVGGIGLGIYFSVSQRKRNPLD
jgi:LysM repeat protein